MRVRIAGLDSNYHRLSAICTRFNLPDFLLLGHRLESLPGNSILTANSAKYKGASVRFSSGTQSDGTRTMGEAPAILPADQMHLVVPGRSIPSFAHEDTKDKVAPTIRINEAV
jgi:hypothetical protein